MTQFRTRTHGTPNQIGKRIPIDRINRERRIAKISKLQKEIELLELVKKEKQLKVEHITTGPHVLSGIAGFLLGRGGKETPAPNIKSQSEAEEYVRRNPHKVVVYNMKSGQYSTRDRGEGSELE